MSKIKMEDLHDFNLICTSLPDDNGKATYTVMWNDDDFDYHIWLYPTLDGKIIRPNQIFKNKKLPQEHYRLYGSRTTYLKDDFKKNSNVIDEILKRCTGSDLKSAQDRKREKDSTEEERQRTTQISFLKEQAAKYGFKLVPL